ncbi:MAG: hypothetical protein AAFO91_18865, partial [Bacteroidota bacterium]
ASRFIGGAGGLAAAAAAASALGSLSLSRSPVKSSTVKDYHVIGSTYRVRESLLTRAPAPTRLN